MHPQELPTGLYESLLTDHLHTLLAGDSRTAKLGKVDDADQAHVLSRHLTAALHRRLASIKNPAERLAVANDLLHVIQGPIDSIREPVEELHRLSSPGGPGHTGRLSRRPKTPLNDAALLTNAHGEPNLATELKAEIDSADSIDLLCAFVMWPGLRLIESELERAHRAGVPIRVVTTTYIGGTERRALDRLVNDLGAEVRVQYDAQRTRLHAKAWLFARDTGFDTAYVGSSNLTTSAMLEGVEWNVRLSRATAPTLLEKFRATFDTYWNSPEFESYDPLRDRDRLDDALLEAKGIKASDRVTISIAGLEVRPYPYQQEMLDALDAERLVHDRHRNLIVAATGTGKTVIAALDYRNLARKSGSPPSLLFVAHRKEILEQSMRTYREVLSDGSFGELYVGGQRPERWKHVFASVQSLTSYGASEIPADAFEVVVIDEFHHAEARTYRRLLDHLAPKELLGLTATPERGDGVDVRSFFGGRIAAELRLWDALGADLLCPFHYFGIADGTDLRGVTWRRGRYDEGQLEGVFTGNDARARIILRALRDKVSDVGQMRALGFCVGVQHAEYMAEVFNAAGIPARAVTGGTPPAEREKALRDLRSRAVNILFAVDVFNEGLDIPDVDTVLFLRPTESATIFMQQLGRGLRRTHTKAVLTVLDFVGHHRKEFNFARRFSALTGLHGKHLEKGVQEGFPFLPSGCHVHLDRQSQETVLENLRSQITPRWGHLVGQLQEFGEASLPRFLEDSGLELSDILRRGKGSWTQLMRDAGLQTREGADHESRLLRRVGALAHVDDPGRAQLYRRLVSDNPPNFSDLTPFEQTLGNMLCKSLWPDGGGFSSTEQAIEALRREKAVRAEVSAVIDLSFDASRHVSTPLAGHLSLAPLRVHARYRREEILSGLGYKNSPTSVQQGAVYLDHLNTDVFLITLKKSEADFSPSTMYADYPISRDLFHWETQSRTSIASPTGQRYINGGSTILLFARQEKENELGAAPYLFLGPATYVSHENEAPIAFTWKLETPLPMDFFQQASAVAS